MIRWLRIRWYSAQVAMLHDRDRELSAEALAYADIGRYPDAADVYNRLADVRRAVAKLRAQILRLEMGKV